jgi:hypothetical protein
MKQCVNEVVAFGMNDTELRVVATVAAFAAVVYFFKLIHKYS